MMWMICALAWGADIDRAPSGTIVTVRPEEGERAWILDVADQPVSLPVDMHQPMWLVHPESWRQAVAMAEKYQILSVLPDELRRENLRLEQAISDEKKLRSGLRLELEASEATRVTEVSALKKSRLHWALGAGAVGLVSGAALAGLALGAL